MYLSQCFLQNKGFSFEVFPPKASGDAASVEKAVAQICALSPAFVSVTYGAGGGNSAFSQALATRIQRDLGVEALAHLTCIGAEQSEILERLQALRAAGVENILALRGDRPRDGRAQKTGDYPYALALVREIMRFGGFCVGGACYPEGHVEARSLEEDVRHLKEKVDAGCSFLITQMFFDNDVFYRYRDYLYANGIRVPLLPGIMPVTNAAQIARICELSGTRLSPRLMRMCAHFAEKPAAMQQAGIVFACEQIVDLRSNGVPHVHIYCMNRPQTARAILQNVDQVLCT